MACILLFFNMLDCFYPDKEGEKYIMQLKNLSYRAKLFIVFSITTLLAGTMIVAGFYLYIRNNIRTNSNTSMQQAADKIATSFNYMLSNMNITASQICTDNSIQEVMLEANQNVSSSNYFNGNLPEKNKITSRLYAINSPYMLCARISLFDDYHNYIHFGSIPYSNVDPDQVITSYNFNKGLQENIDAFMLLPPSRDHWNQTSASPSITFSLVRRIYDLDNPSFPTIGYVDVQQPYSLLESTCTKLLPENYKLQILDADGHVIYPFKLHASAPEPAISKEELALSADHDPHINSSIVYCSAATNSDWTILLYQNKSLFLAPEHLVRNYMCLILILFYITSAFLIFLISRNVTRPIRDIVKNLENISIENTAIDFDLSTTNNEIVLLNNALKTTLDRLAESSKREIQAQANESYSHMLALQAQMDPHFLYNTLMALNGLAMQNDCSKISMMCSRLSSMLRYTASYDEQNITFSQECDYAIAYLELMKVRYDDFLEYRLNCSEELKHISVPKLILQPIIENCFKHGFSNTLPPYRIRVSIRRNGEFWLAQICDNGCGFDSRFINEFNDTIESYEECSGNIGSIIKNSHLGGAGLKNLYIRIKLFYNSPFIFKLENQPDGGGCVTIGGKIYEEDTDR